MNHQFRKVFTYNIELDIHDTAHPKGVKVGVVVGVGYDCNLKRVLLRVANRQTHAVNSN